MGMQVTFYFDPSCPFSWITSRWLLLVAPEREVTVSWRPFCLALKNDEVVKRTGETTHAAAHRDAHRALRLMLAAERDHGTPLVESYSASGRVRHIMGDPLDNPGLERMLAQLKLPTTLLSAADDASFDTPLRAHIAEAVTIVGEDIGVPTLVYALPNGTKQGYFGPVLDALPDKAEALAIWDGLAALATTTQFYELKRNRPSGSPDVASTARC